MSDTSNHGDSSSIGEQEQLQGKKRKAEEDLQSGSEELIVDAETVEISDSHDDSSQHSHNVHDVHNKKAR